MALESAWIPLAGALFGGIGLKMLEHWLGRSKVKIDEATKIRDELRIEINSLRAEINKLEEEATVWREKYFDLREKHLLINAKLVGAVQRLHAEGLSTESLDPPPGI